MKKEKGQVSIETLLLASIIIMLSISVLGYYTRIMSSTIALETIEVETLKQIDAHPGKCFITAIEYKAEANCDLEKPLATTCFCIMLEPEIDILNTANIKNLGVNDDSFIVKPCPGSITNKLMYLILFLCNFRPIRSNCNLVC